MNLPAFATLASCLLFTASAFAENESNPEKLGSEYPTVASALDGLSAKKGVSISVQSGWTVIEDRSTQSLWSFAPHAHPAYPAAIRRKVIQDGDNIFVQMHILCEAPKAACDALAADFEKLNRQMTEDMKRRAVR